MHEVDPLINTLYQVFDLIGVVLNGIIGGTIARKREFDFVGFIFLALFSALGGGMIRDMLIGQGPAAAVSDPWYLSLALVGALIAFLTDFKGKAWELFRVHGDAVILGVWSITGCVKGLTFDMPLVTCVFLGLLTAVGGGMVRDVASGQTPGIFGGSPLYAVPAIIGGIVMVTFAHFDHMAFGMIISPFVGTGLAVLAYWRGWILPRTGVAPVNYTADQVKAIARRAERKGFRAGAKALRKMKKRPRD
ncbi:trimeric intracellular cation channel family protein [Corynebacterium camporealensis]|uniref:trimeric intracellular cation channel family protein n=1 Tax=Corynebacterium camporealensis TaxID=161896 RepID=UPI0034CEBDEE